jgi:hypothetical protein
MPSSGFSAVIFSTKTFLSLFFGTCYVANFQFLKTAPSGSKNNESFAANY